MVGTGGIEIVSEVKAMGAQIQTVLHSEAELPLTVRDAARFLGVSSQTVYLWVERKQIPHLRVMGRNIRFLKSDLEPFRAQFKYEVENGKA
jgi:excisionase family DNA binding protein